MNCNSVCMEMVMCYILLLDQCQKYSHWIKLREFLKMPRENENDDLSSAANGSTRPSAAQENDTSSIPVASAISDNSATSVTRMSVNDVDASSTVQMQVTSSTSDNMQITPPVSGFDLHAVADADRLAANNAQPEQNNNVPQQQQQHPLFNVRDRLFHALFQRIAFAYARSVPRHVRIALECFALFKVCTVCWKFKFQVSFFHFIQRITCVQHHSLVI